MTVDFTTDDWSFRLDGAEKMPEEDKPRCMIEMLPYVSSPEKWEQYCDEFVYEADKAVRAWIEKMMDNPSWKQPNPRNRRYTAGMIFEQAFGRKWTDSDNKYGTRWSKILQYYSSKIQKEASINGKKYTKNVYTISVSRFKRVAPFSLKLRLEWMANRGILPNNSNMRLPRDTLKPGHARNKRTDANMERRRQQARDRFNERYNKKRYRGKKEV